MDDALIIALVGVAAAILGSVTGGAITGWVTLRVERERREGERARDAEREVAAVRGIARVTSARLGAAIAACKTTLDQGVWWPPALEVAQPLPLPIEDRKLLASVMHVEQWVLVNRAEFALVVVQDTRRLSTHGTLTENDREVLEQARNQLDAGQGALKELAMS
jgi:hypothetical protein